MTKIFISYARKDGKDLALRLQNDLTQAGLDVWLDTQRLHGGANWTTEIERAITQAHSVLAILTPSSFISSICRAEQLRALRQGKPVIPLIGRSNTDIPLHLETANYRDFAAGSYSDQLRLLLQDISAGTNTVLIKQKFRTTHVTAPPLPRNYLPRPEMLASLRDLVVHDEPGSLIALTALKGMGGIGKTVLAQALSQDEVVQQAFPDGIVWNTIGKEPVYNLITRLQDVRLALGDKPDANESELHCINRYRTILREKAALVILDDVWRSQDIEPFLAESPRSQLLFTTRDADIVSATGARLYQTELLTPEQSRALLARWAEPATGNLPPEVDDLISECGRLPLALSMVGAMLRGKLPSYWGHVLALLRRADLQKIRAQFPLYPHADMLRAIQVSVDAMEGPLRNHYLALAVLLDDMPVGSAIQRTLWNVDGDGALEIAERFISLSLAQRDGEAGIRLHDLQLDYVRTQYPADPQTLDLIHGAIRLSSHVIERDPNQFASQVEGRLLLHRDNPVIARWSDQIAAAAPRPWLRTTTASLHPPGSGLLRTLEGHSSVVYGVAVTADGRRAVSASWDNTLKVWDVESGRELRTLAGHSGFVLSVAVTADGRRAVSASNDKMLKVWDVESGRELRTLQGHSASVLGVAVTADGGRAVSASGDKTLKVWDLESGRELRTLQGHSDRVHGVAVTADGGRAVSASGDKTLKVWDLESGRELRTLRGHSLFVNGVAVTADGRRAVSASGDNTLKVWDLESGRELRMLQGHTSYVYGVAVTADGRSVVSASEDKTLKVWDLESGRELRTLQGHSDRVHGVAVTADGRSAVSASRDNTLKVWDLESGRELRPLQGHSDRVHGVAVTADGGRAVSASWDNTLKVWDTESGRELRTLQGHSSYVHGVAVTADGGRAVSASEDKTLKVWDLESGRELGTLERHSWSVTSVAVTADGRCAVSASGDYTLKVWDLESGRELRTLQGHSDRVHGVAVTADGRRAVSASMDKTLKVWDLESGRELGTLEGHSDCVNGVAVTADGQRVVSASWDFTLKVWDLESGRELHTLQGHSSGVNGVAVTADGRCAVSASRDKTLKVWDLETGLVLATFTCDAAGNCVSTAMRTIAAGDALGRVHFLSLQE